MSQRDTVCHRFTLIYILVFLEGPRRGPSQKAIWKYSIFRPGMNHIHSNNTSEGGHRRVFENHITCHSNDD